MSKLLPSGERRYQELSDLFTTSLSEKDNPKAVLRERLIRYERRKKFLDRTKKDEGLDVNECTTRLREPSDYASILGNQPENDYSVLDKVYQGVNSIIPIL